MTEENYTETGIPGIKLKPGGSITATGNAKITIKMDDKEYVIESKPDETVWIGKVAPETKLEIDKND